MWSVCVSICVCVFVCFLYVRYPVWGNNLLILTLRSKNTSTISLCNSLSSIKAHPLVCTINHVHVIKTLCVLSRFVPVKSPPIPCPMFQSSSSWCQPILRFAWIICHSRVIHVCVSMCMCICVCAHVWCVYVYVSVYGVCVSVYGCVYDGMCVRGVCV